MISAERITNSMRLVAADCETDAALLDGTPLTGLAVGTNLGDMYAQIQACAIAIIALAELQTGQGRTDEETKP